MNRTTLPIGVLLALACTACSQSSATDPKTSAPPADTSKDIADIKALEDHFIKAVAAKNVDTIMSFYVPDATLFVFDVTPPRQHVGAPDYHKDWEDLMSTFPGPIEATMTDVDITATDGNLAFGHSIQRLVGTMKDGKKLDFTVRITDGYKKVNGQWLIALEHVSVPVDVATGKADLDSRP